MGRPERRLLALASCALASCALALGGTDARAARIRGRVVEVTVRETFVSLGARHGLRPGDRVVVPLADKSTEEATVLDVWSAGARVATRVDRPMPLRGGTAWAEIPPERAAASRPAASRPRQLPPPRSEAELAGCWEGVALERTEKVEARARRSGPGEASGAQRVNGSLQVEYLGVYELGEAQTQYHRLGLASELSLAGRWLDYAHRIRLRAELSPGVARPYPASRPNLLVQTLRGGLHLERLDLELGRMEGAPLPISSLVDGASVRVRITPSLHVGAFGGLAPREADLRPSTESGVFGAYGSLRLAPRAGAWQVSADLGMVGSTWEGGLDRKAVVAELAARGARVWLHASAVADLHRAEDPGQRPALDLTHATLELGGEPLRGLRIDARCDYYRPVMTREALALLSPEFLATDAVLALRGSIDYRISARLGVDAELIWERAPGSRLLVGGGGLHASSLIRADDRVWIAVSAAGSTLEEDLGGRAGYALPLGSWASATASYAVHYVRDRAGLGAGVRHGPALELDLSFRHWTAALDAVAAIGPGERALVTFATLGYRFR